MAAQDKKRLLEHLKLGQQKKIRLAGKKISIALPKIHMRKQPKNGN